MVGGYVHLRQNLFPIKQRVILECYSKFCEAHSSLKTRQNEASATSSPDGKTHNKTENSNIQRKIFRNVIKSSKEN